MTQQNIESESICQGYTVVAQDAEMEILAYNKSSALETP
jgi:hypothetical protein